LQLLRHLILSCSIWFSSVIFVHFPSLLFSSLFPGLIKSRSIHFLSQSSMFLDRTTSMSLN
jgi:hypothetical protein